MNKKKIKVIMTIIPLVLAVSFLSGCIAQNAIQTKHWDHINSEGTGVRLWGFLILGENFHNWDGYLVYDTEKHDNWEFYKYRVEADNYDSFNFFSADVYNLSRTTTYHYRAVGENKAQGATIRVGVDRTFIPGGPRVIVKPVSDIGLTSAVINGELTHMGGAAECKVFFRYGTDPDNLDMVTPEEIMTSTGDFSYEITGLTSCQQYTYKAIAQNDADVWDSLYVVTFTPGMPIVETYLPNNVTETSALYRGQLFDLGGSPSCDVWFIYGNKSPDQLDEITDSITLTIPQEFSIEIDGLIPATTYWVRSVADNGVCENMGVVKEFRTAGPLGFEPESHTKDFDMKTRIQNLIKTRYSWLEDYISDYPMFKKIFD